MNFIHEIRPCAERAARLADGSIDFRRYEWIARKERRAAISRVLRGIVRVLGILTPGPKLPAQATRRTGVRTLEA